MREEGLRSIGAEEVAAYVRERAPVVVDVREGWEVKALPGLAGAVNIPFSRFKERMGELDPGREVLLYCAVGGRSREAGQVLRAAGYRKVAHIRGGFWGIMRRWWGGR